MISILESNRENVRNAYAKAVEKNRLAFAKGDVHATSEYVYANQQSDAQKIVDDFYQNPERRIISISKKTKVGMDGLMIQLAYLMTTHPDNAFVVPPGNVRILTGMSNVGWEEELKSKAPTSFQTNIFHHGKLHIAHLQQMKDRNARAFIFIDEIDTGDKQMQLLHRTLQAAGMLNPLFVQHFQIRFIFASATMLRELYDLDKWPTGVHSLHRMTIPDLYAGHAYFLAHGMLEEFYPLTTPEAASKWVDEDIVRHYGDADYRIHMVRLKQGKTTGNDALLQQACQKAGVQFRIHDSVDRLSAQALDELFSQPLRQHVVLGIKGFFRRANLIPNAWKLRIGATHELCTKQVDNNVQIQGLPGRMSGYWKDVLDAGHKTGPHRTSLQAVAEYEATYEDPFGENSYRTNGFKKREGIVKSSVKTMVTRKEETQDPVKEETQDTVKEETQDTVKEELTNPVLEQQKDFIPPSYVEVIDLTKE